MNNSFLDRRHGEKYYKPVLVAYVMKLILLPLKKWQWKPSPKSFKAVIYFVYFFWRTLIRHPIQILVITEIGHSSHQYCELALRVEPVVGDVLMALISMGINHGSLEAYAQRMRRIVLPSPTQATLTKPTGILQTGQKRQHPSHIPDYLPAFPDSHAYIQTPVRIFFKNNFLTLRVIFTLIIRLTNNLSQTMNQYGKKLPVRNVM